MRTQTDHKRQVRAGASAFIDMLEAIRARTEADLDAHVEAGGSDVEDARNYPAIVSLIHATLQTHVTDAPPLHRQGFLRALADLLSIEVDGGSRSEGWDPIKTTEPAYTAQSEQERPRRPPARQPHSISELVGGTI
ncbi:hypothetical protein [Paucibacter sp. M5-1]|uniref:hypothetical protein n=1 Tax=Paucibacter sp. M5-1 TaxID=3015998 RepID=UPI0022B907F3|nr:hypothetical protein [Paucibacter sp. M5-1]MCZ7883791.1 hypothetical protein [Paucibacter sp. M5-1]